MTAETDRSPDAAVIIPAHNEASVVGRLLDALRAGAEPGQLEIIVACNACTDATAAVARKRGATVVEIDTPSKMAAIAAGEAVATVFPRCYVDADVEVSGGAVVEVAWLLSSEPGVQCAAPPLRVDTSGRPWLVRAYYALWLRDPYMADQHVGNGFYAVSRSGRQRFDQFPQLLRLLVDASHQPPADDLFVRNLFSREERRVTAGEPFLLQAPWTLRALLGRRIRMYDANRELSTHACYRALPGTRDKVERWAWVRWLLTQPKLLPAAAVFTIVDLLAVLWARWRPGRSSPLAWGRDNTTRSGAAG